MTKKLVLQYIIDLNFSNEKSDKTTNLMILFNNTLLLNSFCKLL